MSTTDSKAAGLRLEALGDLVTLAEYTAWARNGSIKTTYHQVARGACLVPPFAIKPKPLWRRADLQARLDQGSAVLVAQRSDRARRRLRNLQGCDRSRANDQKP